MSEYATLSKGSMFGISVDGDEGSKVMLHRILESDFEIGA